MLESLRPFLTKILNPLAKHLNINPNIVTVISPFIAVLAAYGFANHLLIIGTLAILLSGFLDVVDGAVARYHNKTSKFGAFLDSTMDRFADAIIYIGIIFGGYCDWFIGVLAIHSAITVSYVRARAESQGVECKVGIAERAVLYDNINDRSNYRIFNKPNLLYIHHNNFSNIILHYSRAKNISCMETT